MRMEEIFDDPDVFNPARWETAHAPYSFIGFGGGMHACMGEAFAFLQLRTILAVLLSSFDLELMTPFPACDYAAMVVCPKGTNLVRATRRQGSGVPPPRPLNSSSLILGAKAAALASSGATYSWDEIKKHNTDDDCWLVYKGRVYDVTEYLPMHQGGEENFLKWAGQDLTSLGENLGPQHGEGVLLVLEKFYIGDVESAP